MLVKRLCALAVLAASLLCATPGEAAEVKIAGLLNDAVVISISGELKTDDVQTFDRLAQNLPKAIVTFDSNGGELLAGLEIGESIRTHSYATAVVDGASCASSCALAWLAGVPRFQTPSGRVGFHAAFVMDRGVATERGAANAVVGAYREAYSHPPASVAAAAVVPDPIDNDLKAFAAGDVTTNCKMRCSFGFGAAADDLERLYQAGDWKALARLVIRKMDVDDLPYFYLAAAAVNLKYYKAADKYAAIA